MLLTGVIAFFATTFTLFTNVFAGCGAARGGGVFANASIVLGRKFTVAHFSHLGVSTTGRAQKDTDYKKGEDFHYESTNL